MQEVIEKWKPVLGFEQYYQVSNLGRLKRIAAGKGTYPGRLLRPSVDADGYLFSRLCDGRQKKLVRIHRIVAESFLGHCPFGMEVNHMDGTKSNNCSSNLEYVTVGDNVRHARRIGLWKGQVKLTADDIAAIRLESKSCKQWQLAEKYGVGQDQISRIINGKRWGWLDN